MPYKEIYQYQENNKQEKAVLVSTIIKKEEIGRSNENLEELTFLAKTAGAEVIGNFTQKINFTNSSTYIGKGKLKEISAFIKFNKADLVIFDDELTPSQFKNVENELECKVLDRTNLILDIFARRAKTSQAKLQVELAQYEYLLPRLTRRWTHLERQKGGIGLRGPGETEIETDRRFIRNKIAILKKKLKDIDKQNTIQRRKRSQKVRVALVGYTNAGKSTVMNLLSKANVFAEDKLFATLDTTVRNVVIDNITFLLSDTVGFIRKLPHHLVESFKSTLDEAREADILLHIIDLSHPDYTQQIKTVNETLLSLNGQDKPQLLVFNKIDKVNGSFLDKEGSLAENDQDLTELLKRSFLNKHYENVIFISAKEKMNLTEFRQRLLEMVIETYKLVYPHFPLTVID
jgi:GTPase